MLKSSHSYNISIEFTLKVNGPKIEPRGPTYSIFNLSLNKTFSYVSAMGTIAEIGE